MIIDPSQQTYKENYRLMIGSIVPRPIAFVSSLSADGVRNLAPFSFFTGISTQPPTICFTSSRRASDGCRKDTLNNIEATGEFVVNMVSEDIVVPMNECATDFSPDVDEFEVAGLTPVASERVRPPRVGESPISFECKLYQTLSIGPEGAGGGTLIIGEIVLFHVRDDLFDERRRILMERFRPVGRLGGPEYTKIGERFKLERKKPPAGG